MRVIEQDRFRCPWPIDSTHVNSYVAQNDVPGSIRILVRGKVSFGCFQKVKTLIPVNTKHLYRTINICSSRPIMLDQRLS